MRLYFLRHGVAEDRAPGVPDAGRKLTPEGIVEMKQVALGMKALDLRIGAVITSPLVRARETAVIAARALELEDRLKEDDRLACGCGLRDLGEALAGQDRNARVLLVGHEPDMSEMVGELIGGGVVRMKKAALACVETQALSRGSGELRWLLEPDHAARLGIGLPEAR